MEWVRQVWHARVVAPLKRRFWIFRLSDFALHRLRRQDQTDQRLDTLVHGHNLLTKLVVDMEERLRWYEQGPLKPSKTLRAKALRRKAPGKEVGAIPAPPSAPSPA